MNDELPLWSAPFGLTLLDHVKYKPGITALDIGCGAGFPLIELAMRLGKTSTVYGIDPNPEALACVNRKIQDLSITNIQLIEGMAEEIPLGDRTIDLIVSNNGINNVSDINKVLGQCARAIKPGGQFVLSMNLNKTMHEFYDQMQQVLMEFRMYKEIDLMKSHIYEKRRPLKEIIDMLQDHGFEITGLEQDEFSYQFADAAALFSHHFIRTAFMPSWMKLLPEDKAEEIFEIIKFRLDEQAREAGFLKLSVPFAVINAVKA
jgi:ubiquinone/menaquinone biosynthesis C-methylase UbiE